METEYLGTPTVQPCTRVAPETGATLNKTEDDVAACRNICPTQPTNHQPTKGTQTGENKQTTNTKNKRKTNNKQIHKQNNKQTRQQQTNKKQKLKNEGRGGGPEAKQLQIDMCQR